MKAAAIPSHTAGISPAAAPASKRRAGVACAASASRRDLLIGTGAAGLMLSGAQPSIAAPASSNIYRYSMNLKGQSVPLDKYKGQVLCIVNVYGSQGFNVMAVPCNQFGGQAPGSNDQEREYAIRKFGFEFDVYDKVDVNGQDAHPLYSYLRKTLPPQTIEWNYTKFLIDRNGQPVKRFRPSVDPREFEDDVRLLLANKEVLSKECVMHPGRSACQIDKLLAA